MSKIFQIWVDYGTPIPERVRAAMAENMAKADYYTLIAETNFLGAQNFRPYAAIEAEAIRDHRMRDMFRKKNKWTSTEALRAWFLWKNPEYTYLDADLRILKPLVSRPGSPAFARYGDGIDCFLIQGNGCGGWFNDLLTNMHALSPGECFPMVASLPRDWGNVIEPEYFEHFYQNTLPCPDVLEGVPEEYKPE